MKNVAFTPRRAPGLTGPRPRSLGTARITRAERAELARDEAELRRSGIYRLRPRRVGECPPTNIPCPWVGCRFHLFLEVDDLTHAVKSTHPGLDYDQIPETCSLRLAAGAPEGMTLEAIGRYMNVTLESIRLQ